MGCVEIFKIGAFNEEIREFETSAINHKFVFREQLSLEPKEFGETTDRKQDWKNSQKIIEKLTTEVLILQEEKISLKAKVSLSCYSLLRH